MGISIIKIIRKRNEELTSKTNFINENFLKWAKRVIINPKKHTIKATKKLSLYSSGIHLIIPGNLYKNNPIENNINACRSVLPHIEKKFTFIFK